MSPGLNVAWPQCRGLNVAGLNVAWPQCPIVAITTNEIVTSLLMLIISDIEVFDKLQHDWQTSDFEISQVAAVPEWERSLKRT